MSAGVYGRSLMDDDELNAEQVRRNRDIADALDRAARGEPVWPNGLPDWVDSVMIREAREAAMMPEPAPGQDFSVRPRIVDE